jgi:hypothetical protein
MGSRVCCSDGISRCLLLKGKSFSASVRNRQSPEDFVPPQPKGCPISRVFCEMWETRTLTWVEIQHSVP